ncbi:MAG TPA: hypothetical protein VF223_18595 [Trebonia sp.]
MLADKRRQDFHDDRVVSGRVAGDAFQRVDTADPDVQLLGSELLDRLGLAVGYLALTRQAVVPCGVYQRGEGGQASAQCEQLRPDGLTCRLQIHCTLRTRDQANIVCGDQISKRPDERADKHKADKHACHQNC